MGIFRQGACTPGTNQTFSTATGVSGTSNAVGSGTGVIRVAVTTDTYANVWQTGGNVTTNSNNMILPGESVNFFTTLESLTQVGFLAVTTAGKISITEC